ncbi:uncharacterized protein Dvar_50250 [Desulfosarcina variabilis str. Montpellier]
MLLYSVWSRQLPRFDAIHSFQYNKNELYPAFIALRFILIQSFSYFSRQSFSKKVLTFRNKNK